MGLISYWLESLDYDYKILPHCSLYQSPLSSCTRCIDSCPENAIQLKDGKPVINTTKCTQCGDCIASCPVQGVEGFLPKRSIINNQFVIDPQSIPSIKELLIYYKKGITTLIYEKKELPLLWKTTIEDTNKLLAKLGEQPFNIINKHKSVDDSVMTRRELFSTWEKDLKNIAMEMVPAKWRFNHESLDLSAYYTEHQFVDIFLDTEKCTLCGACEVLCKKDCLQINETGFLLMAQNCSNCFLCQDICPEKAISLKEKVSSIKEVTHNVYRKVCSICDREYETLDRKKKLCVSCRKKKEFSMI